MTDLRICELERGDALEDFFLLRAAQNRMSANGKPFLSAVLADRTGEIEAKVWDYPGPIGPENEGQVVKIRGAVTEYRGSLQITVERIRLADDNDLVDLSALVPTAPIDAKAALAEVKALAASIKDDDYRRVCEAILQKHEAAFARIPAAKSVHHSFVSGLLMHTLNMMRTADFLAGLYADTVDRSLLLAGTLLHDMGKEREFTVSELGLVTDYSPEGELLGHLVMGAREVSETAEKLGVPA
ncbi:MAG: HDIG domain-containing protein, partial [Oscillospiraceae bacterium]|nr:HDIG domain-containing protein [Oscillospiraceae bacterium]